MSTCGTFVSSSRPPRLPPNLCLNDYANTVDGGLVMAMTPPHMH